MKHVKAPLVVSVGLIVGCASANRADTVADAVESDEVVEIIVTNNHAFPVTVDAWWEHRGRVSLGDIGGRGRTRSFTFGYRDELLGLFARLADGGGSTRLRPSIDRDLSVLVRPGDRLQSIIQSVGGGGRFFELWPAPN